MHSAGITLNTPFDTLLEVNFLVLMVSFFSALHPLNAFLPIVFTFLGIVNSVNLPHPLNAYEPILVTLVPIVTFLRLLQLLNAPVSIIFTVLGIETFLRDVRAEMRLVRWPSKEEVVKYTIATLVFVGFFALFFYGIDALFALVKGMLNK